MTDEKDGSSSILIPFDQKWEEPIREQRILVVFRKRGPKTVSPECIFVYIGSPKSSLIGRFQVETFSFLPLENAVKLATSGGLTEADLRAYAGDYRDLAVFKVKAFEPASTPLSLSQLSSDYGFYPPQSFLRLSEQGRMVLNDAIGFSRPRSKPRRAKQ